MTQNSKAVRYKHNEVKETKDMKLKDAVKAIDKATGAE